MTSPENIKRGLAAFAQAQQLHAARKLPEAAAAFQRATALMPDHPQLLTAYGALAEEVGDFRTAEKLYRRIGELRPESGFEGRLAIVLFQLQKYAEAIPYFEALLRQPAQQRSPNPDILHGLCNCLCMTGRWTEGLELARRALALREDVRYHDSELNALYHLGHREELDACIDDMLARYPDSREIRSMYALHKLKSGDFREGFRYFAELRWRNTLRQRAERGSIDNYAGTWDGQAFDGVLIVTAEQGLGDEIMLSSMVEELVATGQRVMIECDERLLPLYQRSMPGIEFLPKQQNKLLKFTEGTTIRNVTALDLANVLRNDVTKFPSRRSWLSVDTARRDALRADYRRRFPGKRLVGLSWKSARTFDGGATKNIDIFDFSPLLADPDVQFINLQYGNIDGELAALRGAGLTLHFDESVDPMRDVDGFAAQVAALDLTISTSNTTVHVAGAIGSPCWLLLPRTQPILWYWGYRGESTPWYPSLRLWRNPREDSWSELLANVHRQLQSLPPASGISA